MVLAGSGQPDAWDDDLGPLYILESFTVPLPVVLPSERRERERIYRESGELTREVITRVLLGEFD